MSRLSCVQTVQCPDCPVSRLSSVQTVQCPDCPVSRQCPDCPVSRLSSVQTVHCPDCPVSSVQTVQCPDCPVSRLSSVQTVQCPDCHVQMLRHAPDVTDLSTHGSFYQSDVVLCCCLFIYELQLRTNLTTFKHVND